VEENRFLSVTIDRCLFDEAFLARACRERLPSTSSSLWQLGGSLRWCELLSAVQSISGLDWLRRQVPPSFMALLNKEQVLHTSRIIMRPKSNAGLSLLP